MDQERVWVEQARTGDQAAFARLVAAYQGPVFNLAYRMLGNAGDAEDAAQETFLRAYDRLASYEPGRKFSSWILAIASHYCIDQLRRRHVDLESLEGLPAWRYIPSQDEEPEDAALVAEQERSLQQALDALPPAYRLPLILRYWYDLSYDEMAEASHSTVSAVKSRLHRARLMLADRIEAGGPTQDGRPTSPDGRQGHSHERPLHTEGLVAHALRAR